MAVFGFGGRFGAGDFDIGCAAFYAEGLASNNLGSDVIAVGCG